EVIVRGLPPRSTATLHASWSAFGGHVWSSSVQLRAAPSGVVTLRGVDGMRFLWGMRPTGLPFEHPFFLPPAVGPSAVRLSVSVDGDTVARAVLSRRVTPPSVKVRKLTVLRDGVFGVLFTPMVPTHRPAAVVFGGSEGGDTMIDVAGLLAAHGYPALSLAYFGEPGLPSEFVRIPLEYFARAVRLLDGVPVVDPAHVVVMGASRGGEAALLLAATFPRLIHGAIGLVPSASVYPAPAANLRAWTLHGTAVPLEQIPVERITGPVLTVGAGEDQVWSSAESVQQIEQRFARHKFRFRHEGRIYPRAGHAIAIALPYLPVSTEESASGGSPRADTAARADLWPHILNFFAALRRN
ncbi:MAG: dienelactone hydrolase family protein, partial [Solirubrobacterales bacterium]|nr:dienelactone hydrolase family protein [Solirubrobacterales bacterium]